MDHHRFIPPREVCAALNISIGTFYNRVKDGEITAVKNGRRTFVTSTELDRYRQSLPAIQPRHASTGKAR